MATRVEPAAHWSSKLLLLYVYALLQFAYTWFLVRRLKAGPQRLLVSLPALVGSLLLPLVLDPFCQAEAMLITPLGGVFSLAAFKLAAFCMERGPLAMALTPAQFGVVLIAPITPASGRSPRHLLMNYFKGTGGALVVSSILLSFPNMHWFPRHWLYTLCSCLFLGAVFDIFAAVAGLVLDMPVTPAFNKPWLSGSFADFWARRWNLTTTYLMRSMIYEPIMQGCFVAPQLKGGAPGGVLCPGATAGSVPPQADPHTTSSTCTALEHKKKFWRQPGVAKQTIASMPYKHDNSRAPASQLRRFLALQATFMFSGVWHILVFYYNSRQISYRWAIFFIAQAPIVMSEHLLGKAWKTVLLPHVPQACRIVLTNAALIMVAGPLFFGPADESGFVRRNLAAVAPLLNSAYSLLGLPPVTNVVKSN